MHQTGNTLHGTGEGAKHPRRLQVAILAGGASTRMKTDKAFLIHRGRPFISWIVEQASSISEDVLVIIGNKDRREFQSVLDSKARIVNDVYTVGTPLGGMFTAFGIFHAGYVAVLACDTPLVKAGVIEFLMSEAISHSAAVPVWDSGDVEPLCSVYHADEAWKAAEKAIESGRVSCRDMISLLRDVNYVPVSRLRAFDPLLYSLTNVNTPFDLRKLERLPAQPYLGSVPDELLTKGKLSMSKHA